jgi:hypothetical protein
MPQSPGLDRPLEEPAAMLAALRRARYGYLLARRRFVDEPWRVYQSHVD